MNLFSKLVTPIRKAKRNFERARKAEQRADYAKAEAYFTTAAQAYDEHFSKHGEQAARPSQLIMAGICYVRTGRNEDALDILDTCLAKKDIPDAFLHAGYAAAKVGDKGKAMGYWSRYPAWYEQRIVHSALKETLHRLKDDDGFDLQAACESVAKAIRTQDKENENRKRLKRGKQTYPPNKGY